MGQLADISEPFPAAIFEGKQSTVAGALIWLNPGSFADALKDLDRYEDVPTLFRRVRVEAQTDGAVVAAYAYERVGETWQAYCDAATRKVAIAAYHVGRLSGELRGSRNPVAVQAHFEEVLFATIAASDQFAEALNRRLNLGIDSPNLQRAAEAMPRSPLRRSLIKWQQEPIGADLRELRRRATHHYYWKTTGAPQPLVQPPQDGRAYGGPRDLVSYCRAIVNYMRSN